MISGDARIEAEVALVKAKIGKLEINSL